MVYEELNELTTLRTRVNATNKRSARVNAVARQVARSPSVTMASLLRALPIQRFDSKFKINVQNASFHKSAWVAVYALLIIVPSPRGRNFFYNLPVEMVHNLISTGRVEQSQFKTQQEFLVSGVDVRPKLVKDLWEHLLALRVEFFPVDINRQKYAADSKFFLNTYGNPYYDPSALTRTFTVKAREHFDRKGIKNSQYIVFNFLRGLQRTEAYDGYCNRTLTEEEVVAIFHSGNTRVRESLDTYCGTYKTYQSPKRTGASSSASSSPNPSTSTPNIEIISVSSGSDDDDEGASSSSSLPPRAIKMEPLDNVIEIDNDDDDDDDDLLPPSRRRPQLLCRQSGARADDDDDDDDDNDDDDDGNNDVGVNISENKRKRKGRSFKIDDSDDDDDDEDSNESNMPSTSNIFEAEKNYDWAHRKGRSVDIYHDVVAKRRAQRTVANNAMSNILQRQLGGNGFDDIGAEPDIPYTEALCPHCIEGSGKLFGHKGRHTLKGASSRDKSKDAKKRRAEAARKKYDKAKLRKMVRV